MIAARPIQGIGRKQIPIKTVARGKHDRRDLDAEDPEQAGHRNGHEQGLLPAERSQVVHGQRQQGERHQHLEGAALEGAFLDAVDLEDGQKQAQKRQVAQERPEAAAAGFGLAWIETLPRPLLGALVCRRRRQVLLVQCPLRLRCDRASSLCPHGSAPSRLIRSTGVALFATVGPVPPAGPSDRGLWNRADCTFPEPLPAGLQVTEPLPAGTPGSRFRSNSRQRAGLDGTSAQDGGRPEVGCCAWRLLHWETAGAGSSVNR